MARNAIESEFRTSKMAGGGHFVKNLNKNQIAQSPATANVFPGRPKSAYTKDTVTKYHSSRKKDYYLSSCEYGIFSRSFLNLFNPCVYSFSIFLVQLCSELLPSRRAFLPKMQTSTPPLAGVYTMENFDDQDGD